MLENAGNPIVSPYHIWIFSSCAASSANFSQPVQLRVDNFNQVMAGCKLSVTLEIENLIPQSDSVSFVTVEINSLDDFHPLTLAKNLSVLNPLTEACQAISARLENKIDENRFNEILTLHRTHPLLQSIVNNILKADNTPDESAVQQPSQDDEAIDRLFGMLDLGEQLVENPQHDDSGKNLFSRSYQALLTTSLHDIQRVLFQQLNKIIHHEEFQKLEQTWRGLKRVVDALPEDDSVILTLINQIKTGFALRLVELLETTGEHELPILVLHDFVINCTPADLTLLDEIAISSEAFQVMSVVNLSNHFMGQSSTKSLLQSENELSRLFAQPQYVKWKTLRSKPHARWLICCFNRFLLRPVYSRHKHGHGHLAFRSACEWS